MQSIIYKITRSDRNIKIYRSINNARIISQGKRGLPGATGLTGPAGVGIPQGGDLGQILAKLSGADYDTSWVDPAASQIQSNWNESNISSPAYIQNKPILGTAAAQNIGFFASAAQGALADSAIQPGDNISLLNDDVGFITGVDWGDITGTLANQTDLVTALDAKVDVAGDTMTGALVINANSTGALQVKNGSTVLLLVDTTANAVSIGGSAPLANSLLDVTRITAGVAGSTYFGARVLPLLQSAVNAPITKLTSLIVSDQIILSGGTSNTITDVEGLFIGGLNFVGTVGTWKGISINRSSIAGTVGTAIGIDIDAGFATAGSTAIGIRIPAPSAGATKYAIQLSDTGATPAGGITFGTDTVLYRSASDVLKTDDQLLIAGSLVVSSTTDPTTSSAITGTYAGSTNNPRNFSITRTFNSAATGPASIYNGATFRPTSNLTVAYGIYNEPTFRADSGITITTAHASYIKGITSSSGSITNLNALTIAAPDLTPNPTNTRGINIENQGKSGVTLTVGIDVAAQSGSTTNLGIRVGLAGTASIQLSDTTGVAAGGILFGGDVTLYRSAADALKTDDSFQVGNRHFINVLGNVIFNETAANADFRIEGQGNPNLFFVDASADFIGIGNSSPGTRLNIGAAFTQAGSNTAGLSISHAGGASTPIGMFIENTGGGGATGGSGMVALANTGGAMGSGDRLGFMLFAGSSSSSSVRNAVGLIAFTSQGWTDGAAYGSELRIETIPLNTTTRSAGITFTSEGGIIVNEQGRDADSRIEGDTDINLLFLDASTDRIGIGVATPNAKLEVNGTLRINETAYFDTEFDNGNSSTADTIDWRVGNKQKSTLTGNCTFTFTAPDGPCNVVLKLIQDATGGRTVTWPATVKWAGGSAPTLTATANKIDIISFYFDGTSYYGASILNYT